MYNAHDLYAAMGRAAINAVEASMPAALMFGTVESVSPLRVNVEQRLTLSEKQLILTNAVSDFSVEVVDNTRRTITVKLGLQAGEEVVLLRMQGGQKYLILDRAR